MSGDSFFTDSYPNLGDGVSGTKIPIIYGRVTVKADLTDNSGNGVYTLADASVQTLFAVNSVWAIDRTSQVWTLLTVTTHYTVNLTACTVTIVDATYIHTSYLIAVDVSGKPDGGSSYLKTFGEIVRDMLEDLVGIPTADIDTTSFSDADTDAPEELAVYLKAPRALTSILSTSQDGFPSLERSVLGHISQSKAGQWTADIWDPSFDASTIGTLRQDEFAHFAPAPSLRRIYGKVQAHYNFDHARGAWEVQTATDTRIQRLADTDDVLDLWTFLRDSSPATVLAQRRLVISGGRTLSVEFDERGIRLCTSTVRTRFYVNYNPAPDLDGKLVDAPMEVVRLDLSLLPQLQVSGLLQNPRGIGELIGRWTASGAPDWGSSTAAEKLVAGYWANSSGLIDPADGATKDTRLWW